jgi:hypothetical protein
MFRPSEKRKFFEGELESRSTSTDEQWKVAYETFGRDRVRELIALVEESAEWPPNKLLPTDSIDLLFHGKAREDMPFGRFRADIRRQYGIRISYPDICQSLNGDQCTLYGLIALILNSSENRVVIEDEKSDEPAEGEDDTGQKGSEGKND